MVHARHIGAGHGRSQERDREQNQIGSRLARGGERRFRLVDGRLGRDISRNLGDDRGGAVVFGHGSARTLICVPGPAASIAAALPSRTAISSISKLPNKAVGAPFWTSP